MLVIILYFILFQSISHPRKTPNSQICLSIFPTVTDTYLRRLHHHRRRRCEHSTVNPKFAFPYFLSRSCIQRFCSWVLLATTNSGKQLRKRVKSMETSKGDTQQHAFLDRATRATRGKRMTKLLNEEVEEDEVFWNQDALKEVLFGLMLP